MTASADLARRLENPNILIDASGPLGGWEDSYIIPGHTRECHPDFLATPIGPDPYGFLLCQRKKQPNGMPLAMKAVNNKPIPYGARIGGEFDGYIATMTQSFDLYNDTPNAPPRRTYLGGQPRDLQHRRYPDQAHLQGSDYYRDSIRYRGIGIENVDARPGEFGYEENKYYFSSPPPLFDMAQAVQPYDLWKREQLRSGNFTPDMMDELESKHKWVSWNPVY